MRSASECVGRRRHCRCDRRTHSDAERTCTCRSNSVHTAWHDTDSTILSCLAWRCELVSMRIALSSLYFAICHSKDEPSGSNSSIRCISAPVPSDRITVPSSLVGILPSPSLSNSENASLYSATLPMRQLSCCSQWPHRACTLANKIEYIDCGYADGNAQIWPPKIVHSPGDPDPHVHTWFFVSTLGSHHKRHLDHLSRFVGLTLRLCNSDAD